MCAVVVIAAAIGVRLRLSPSLVCRSVLSVLGFATISRILAVVAFDLTPDDIIQQKSQMTFEVLKRSRIAHKTAVSARHGEGQESPTLKQMAGFQLGIL